MWAVSAWRGLMGETGGSVSRKLNIGLPTLLQGSKWAELGWAALGRGWPGGGTWANAPWSGGGLWNLGLNPRQGKATLTVYISITWSSPSAHLSLPEDPDLVPCLGSGWKWRSWHHRKGSWGKPSSLFSLKSLLCSHAETCLNITNIAGWKWSI